MSTLAWVALGFLVTAIIGLAWWSYELRRSVRRAKEKQVAEYKRALRRNLDTPEFKERVARLTEQEYQAQLEQQEGEDLERAWRPGPVCACAGTYICETCRRKYNDHRKREKIREFGAAYSAVRPDTVEPLDIYAAIAPVIFTAPSVTPDWSGGGGESGGGGTSGSWDSDSSSSDSSSSSSD